MRDLLRIDESKTRIAGRAWDADDVRKLAAKKIFQFQKCVEYWRPLLERGRVLEDRFEGRIFTEAQRAEYLKDGIIPFEPPIAKAPIRALVGQTIKSRKSGQVVSERSSTEAEDNSDELRVLNAVMKDMEIKTREEHRITKAVESTFVTAWWNVLMFDHDRPSRNSEGLRYKMTNLPWNSCVFGPTTVREPDGSDIKEMFFFDNRSIADLIDNYPKMKKQIEAHFDPNRHGDSGMLSSLRQWEDSMTSEDRDMMYDVLRCADETCAGSGMARVIMHLFPIKRKEEVWVNTKSDGGEDIEIRPPDWDDERWDKWVQDNSDKYSGPYEKEIITLWMTVFTTSGLVLANEKHWFQENGQLPCSFWLGAISSNQPTSPMVDMSEYVLANAVSETEQLSDNRMQSSKALVVKEGTLANMEDVASELTKPCGVIMVDKDSGISVRDAVHEITRTPNKTWGEYSEQLKRGMYENTRINETMMGAVAPRQSAIAKEAEISQALSVNAVYVDNMNRSWQYHQNLKLKMIPYFYAGHEVLEIIDEETNDRQVFEVNAPNGYDIEGNVVSVTNDLTSYRYRWEISPTDDSANAKIRAVEEALVIVNAAAGPLAQADPTGMMFSDFLAALDNPLLKKSGKRMAQTMQQAAQQKQAEEQQKTSVEQVTKLMNARASLERAHKSGMFLNFRADDFSNYPGLLELYTQMHQMARLGVEQDVQAAQQAAGPQQPGMDMMGMAGGGQPQGAPPAQEQEMMGPPPAQEPVPVQQ
jgi:hypothetical protein